MLNKINNNKKGQSTLEIVIIVFLVLVGFKAHPFAKAENFTKENLKKVIVGDVYAGEESKTINEIYAVNSFSNRR